MQLGVRFLFIFHWLFCPCLQLSSSPDRVLLLPLDESLFFSFVLCHSTFLPSLRAPAPLSLFALWPHSIGRFPPWRFFLFCPLESAVGVPFANRLLDRRGFLDSPSSLVNKALHPVLRVKLPPPRVCPCNLLRPGRLLPALSFLDAILFG